MSYERHNDPHTPSPLELERIVAFIMKGKLIHDKQAQREDKDVLAPDGEAISVKKQDAAGRTGNISLEVVQTDTRTGKTILGNFHQCKAKYIIIAVPDNSKGKGCYDLYLWEHQALKALSESSRWRRASLTQERLDANRALGKQYDDTTSVLIPLREAAKVGIGVNRMDFAELKRNASYVAFCKLHPLSR